MDKRKDAKKLKLKNNLMEEVNSAGCPSKDKAEGSSTAAWASHGTLKEVQQWAS